MKTCLTCKSRHYKQHTGRGANYCAWVCKKGYELGKAKCRDWEGSPAPELHSFGGFKWRNEMHLRYNMYDSPNEHPQKVIKNLGITYQHSTPQSIGDQWWFWNCENLPEELPYFLTPLDLDPMEQIGCGLSLQDAEKIRDYSASPKEDFVIHVANV